MHRHRSAVPSAEPSARKASNGAGSRGKLDDADDADGTSG